MNMKIKVLTLLCCTLLSGCISRAAYNNIKHNYNHPPLDPPQQNRWLTIDGMIPPEVKVTIVPYYYSTKGCTRNSGDLATYFGLIYPKSGHYSVQIALDGGTRCGWQLDKINISSEINDPNYYNARIPIVSQFAALDSGAATYTFTIWEGEKKGGVRQRNVAPRYYPYASLQEIEKGYPASYSKSMLWLNPVNMNENMTGNKRQTGTSFAYEPGAAPTPLGIIHFSPVVDHDYLVYGTTEGSKLKGNFVYRDYYPNGDVAENEPLRDYRYYDKKNEPKKKNWWDDIPDQPVKPYKPLLE
ncbi:hypothetical protein EHZ47_21850 [Aeromonas jandaei]|uniref:hypothetical protein n=1 Tax=Aeromonas jandaei TaxID=650 RepID=UPI000F528C17|nr:hypothetical protein [Aeromonas jandaei]RQM70515.1 hypothetical protein EHZ47_21850 [Aeromonas jandaei]